MTKGKNLQEIWDSLPADRKKNSRAGGRIFGLARTAAVSGHYAVRSGSEDGNAPIQCIPTREKFGYVDIDFTRLCGSCGRKARNCDRASRSTTRQAAQLRRFSQSGSESLGHGE
jgi:hypothetical protein